jgi:hypothetical protein
MILRTFAIATVATLLWASAGRCDESSQTVTLFDGRSLDGWEGNTKWFRARKGAIVAGSLTEDIPRNEFLCTKGRYGDFELHVKAKLIGRGTNAGVQFRSSRIPNHHEVIGYQADIGTAGGSPIWGCLYDESRRRKMLAVGPVEDVKKILRPGQFHQYVIRCQGDSVRIWLEGKLMVDYREPDAKISREGIIGLQIHGGPPAEAWYKDITIRELK